MKKVAGTLKLDQAEYRELEAFAKFGSDLDASTKAVLDKGARNVEILKQLQYSPMPVEKQIAIIFCGTRNLLKNIPVSAVHNFETEYLNHMETRHKEVLRNLREGKLLDEDVKIMEQTAAEVSKRYEEKK